MPYVICPRCAVRSYVAPGPGTAPCPVCATPLSAAGGTARPATAADSDAQLMGRHRDGDPAAFAILHRRHAAVLLRHAERLVGRVRADDATQDTFERAHRFILGDPRAAGTGFVVIAWLHTVLRHRCLDTLRRDARLVAGGHDQLPTHSPGPHDRAELAEQLDRISVAVHALPARQRAALIWHALDGAPHHDVAQRLDASVGATKCLVNRARSELRVQLAA